jgi:hypothetical protein
VAAIELLEEIDYFMRRRISIVRALAFLYPKSNGVRKKRKMLRVKKLPARLPDQWKLRPAERLAALQSTAPLVP